MRVCPLLLLLAAFLLRGQVAAAELTVGVTGVDQLPIANGNSESGLYEGFARELLDDFAAKNGHVMHYRPLPILRLYDQFLYKQVLQLKFPDNPLWRTDLRRDLPVAYSQPLLWVSEGLAVLPGNIGRKLETLKVIGAVRGYTPYPYLQAIATQQLKLLETSDLQALVALALNGRVDAIYVNATVLNYYLTQQLKQPHALLLDSTLPLIDTSFHVSSISNPEILRQLDQYLLSERQSVARLRAKYLIED